MVWKISGLQWRNKQKVRIKIRQWSINFLDSNFLGVKESFVLIYANYDHNPKRHKARRYYQPKGFIKIQRHHQWKELSLPTNWFWYKTKWSLSTGQGEDHVTGFTLDYDNIENSNKLIAVDLSQQTDVDVDSKAIEQTEVVGKLKKIR